MLAPGATLTKVTGLLPEAALRPNPPAPDSGRLAPVLVCRLEPRAGIGPGATCGDPAIKKLHAVASDSVK